MKQQLQKYILPLLVVSAAAFSFLPSIEFLLNFANDDSFFYLKTAYNFSEGYGSTFDRVDFTNGYHPLWFLLLSVYYFILNIFADFSPEALYRFTVMLILFMNFATITVLYFFFKNSYSENYKKYFYLSIPLYMLFVGIRDFGMETHLLCFIISLYMYFKSVEIIEKRSYSTTKCVLLALIFLTRVDYLLTVIPVIIIFDYFTSDHKTRNNFLKNP